MKLLVAMDETEHSWKILDKALMIGKAFDSEITLIGVVEKKQQTVSTIPFNVVEDFVSAIEKVVQGTLDKASNYCQEKGFTVKTMIEHGQAAEAICRTAEDGIYDLVVVGNSGKGKIEEFLLGSVSSKIAHSVKTNLLIVK